MIKSKNHRLGISKVYPFSIFAIAVLIFSSVSFAKDFNDDHEIIKAYLYLESGKLEESLKVFNDIPDSNSIAQFAIGFMYYQGIGVKKDIKIAKKLFEKASMAGNIEARYWLGRILMFDLGNIRTGVMLMEDSAIRGCLPSQSILSKLYYYGEWVDVNYEKARLYSFLASVRGDPTARRILSFIYLYGKGVDVNIPKSLYWLKESAKKNDKVAQYVLGLMYRDGIHVEKNIKESNRLLTMSKLNGFSPTDENIKKYGVE